MFLPLWLLTSIGSRTENDTNSRFRVKVSMSHQCANSVIYNLVK